MFLAHKIRHPLGTVIVAALSLFAASGCTNQRNSTADPGDTDLIISDEALNQRVWERSHAQYQNMNVVAGPVGDPFIPNENMPDYQRSAVEPGLFVGNTVILPGVFVFFPPWMEMQYRGDTYATSYTGNGTAQLSGAIVTPNTPPGAANGVPAGVEGSSYPGDAASAAGVNAQNNGATNGNANTDANNANNAGVRGGTGTGAGISGSTGTESGTGSGSGSSSGGAAGGGGK